MDVCSSSQPRKADGPRGLAKATIQVAHVIRRHIVIPGSPPNELSVAGEGGSICPLFDPSLASPAAALLVPLSGGPKRPRPKTSTPPLTISRGIFTHV